MVCNVTKALCERKTYKRLVCVLFFLHMIFVLGYLGLYTGSDVRHITEDQMVRKYPNQYFQTKKVKRILYWKPFLDDTIDKSDNVCLERCEAKCEIISKKTDIAKADAVNFHLTDLWPENWNIGTRSTIDFPSYRRPDQVWIVSNMEPPQHLWGDLKVFNGLFNWTQWYRTDADIHWRYGSPYKLTEREKANVYAVASKRNIFKEKSKEIIGRISNCMDINRRYKVIAEMRKYLDIDMFGGCYNNPCGDNPRDELDKACREIMKEYKFYLAFENNDCKDYVTEKYWQSLYREQIPIVNWKSLNRSIVIPNSYINVYDFRDIKSLADYISKVSSNETLYNSYFEWMKSYASWDRCTSCQVCRALHDEDKPAQVIEDFDSWVRNDICQKVEVGMKHSMAISYLPYITQIDSLSYLF